MSKALCPVGCGKKFISHKHAEAHADAEHIGWRVPKQKGWILDGCFLDFAEPVTEEEARALAKEIRKITNQSRERE